VGCHFHGRRGARKSKTIIDWHKICSRLARHSGSCLSNASTLMTMGYYTSTLWAIHVFCLSIELECWVPVTQVEGFMSTLKIACVPDLQCREQRIIVSLPLDIVCNPEADFQRDQIHHCARTLRRSNVSNDIQSCHNISVVVLMYLVGQTSYVATKVYV
jgi:hypothetical protein